VKRIRVPKPETLVRPLVRNLHAYVPGEQPRVKGLIKLNTNENPYPPSPKVIEAIKSATDGRLRLYPNPTADHLRGKLAALHCCRVENIIVGNGSDELLALATRAFAEPVNGKSRNEKSTIQFFSPSYSLYPVLAEAQGARTNSVALTAEFDLPPVPILRKSRAWDFDAALTLITTPNAPSGAGYATSELDNFCKEHRGVMLLDEAYVDFANENAMALALRYPHVLVARTFSKAYSLCFQRVGYCVGHPVLIGAMQKLRDSYNVNGLGQIAAEATLADLSYYEENFSRILATRGRLTASLQELGFAVVPSQTNFILCRPPLFAARSWLEKLRAKKILVRWFDAARVRDYLRITIGTDSEADALLQATQAILKTK
jgi:histidinol-phosphate aminotransferase